MKKHKYILAIFFILASINSYSSDDDSGTFDDFLKKLYNRPVKQENSTLLKFNYGYSSSSFPSYDLSDELSETYPFDFTYGFYRTDDETGVDDIFYHTGEFAFIGSVSSHLKPKSIKLSGITTDALKFGFGITNGYGYRNTGNNVFLSHSAYWSWHRIDVELPATNEKDQKLLDMFDENYKFGSGFQSGLTYQLYKGLNVELLYDKSIVYRDFQFMPWAGSWLIENISQRWLDFFEEEWLLRNKANWPWMHLAIKTFISIAIYEFRRSSMYWPINSESPLNYDGIKIGIVFIL